MTRNYKIHKMTSQKEKAFTWLFYLFKVILRDKQYKLFSYGENIL